MKAKKLMNKKELKEGLEKVLVLAESKLALAIDRNKEWDINHYKGDVALIKEQLSEL